MSAKDIKNRTISKVTRCLAQLTLLKTNEKLGYNGRRKDTADR